MRVDGTLLILSYKVYCRAGVCHMSYDVQSSSSTSSFFFPSQLSFLIRVDCMIDGIDKYNYDALTFKDLGDNLSGLINMYYIIISTRRDFR